MGGKRHDWEVLDPKLREMLAAKWSLREMAEALGVSIQGVKNRLDKLGLAPNGVRGGRPGSWQKPAAVMTFDPPKGRMPALNYLPPAELKVDPGYQRSIEGKESQRLIARIAKRWDWAKCLPLLVSDRGDGELYVIDGQHRLSGARLRGDIAQLPCVVVSVGGVEGEAALFDAVNSQRRALTPLELFRAALASGDPETVAILAAIEAAGLSVAPHDNHTVWKAGMINNVGGIRAAWRQFGARVVSQALQALADAFPGEVLRFGGTLFQGLPPLIAEGRGAGLGEMLATKSQEDWRALILRARAKDPSINWKVAARQVFTDAMTPSGPGFVDAKRFVGGKAWCEQCDMQVTLAEAQGCKSRFCSLKAPAAKVAA